MKFDIQTIKKILRTATHLQKEEARIDKALDNYASKVAPSCVNPLFHERGMLYGYLAALKVIDPNLEDAVSYWIYEMPLCIKHGGACTVKDPNDKHYDATNIHEYAKFMMVDLGYE